MQTALRHGFLALGMLLLGACGSAPPPYQYENNDTLALESIATEGAPVDDLYEYPQLMSMEDGGMAESSAPDFYEPPPMPEIAASDDEFAPLLQSDDVSIVRGGNSPRTPKPQVSAAAYSGSIEGGNEITATAHAYLSALYHGDGETAWRYSFVPYNPQQSWWDERTAKGALFMKAGSSEYFASEKQGVRQIEIAPQSVRQQGNAASLSARIIYGNGTSRDLNLKMMNQGGKWLVPQEYWVHWRSLSCSPPASARLRWTMNKRSAKKRNTSCARWYATVKDWKNRLLPISPFSTSTPPTAMKDKSGCAKLCR